MIMIMIMIMIMTIVIIIIIIIMIMIMIIMIMIVIIIIIIIIICCCCCQITIRQCLNKSPNPDIRNLFKITSHKNIPYDSFSSTKDALRNIRNQKELTVRNLEVQGAVVKDL